MKGGWKSQPFIEAAIDSSAARSRAFKPAEPRSRSTPSGQPRVYGGPEDACPPIVKGDGRVMNRGGKVIVAAALLALVHPLAAHATPIVTVAQGALAGKPEGMVTAFLGIPYAAPPIGPNRWRPPLPAARWSGVRLANAYAASCTQALWPAVGPYTKEFLTTGPVSEDCLYLNVWRPAGRIKPAPVLLWIHGGGFVGGSGAAPHYDGARLAAKGVVVVTINYRLGVFGYLAHPALTAEDPRHTSGNYGLQDQIAALKWVKQNIARFGGDPSNVTVGGESGGAVSVNALIVSPDAVGLFAKGAAYSGTSMGFLAPRLVEAERYGVALARSLKAETASDLRAIPAERVLAAAGNPAPGPAGVPRFAFWPVVDNAVLPEDPNDGSSRPRSVVPLLTGYNTDENFIMSVKGPVDLELYAEAWFGDRAGRILALYPHATDLEARESAKILARDRYMTALVRWTDARTTRYGEVVFRYLYGHPTPVATGPSYGAFHTAGMPYLFGNLDTTSHPYTADDRTVSDVWQRGLLNFMKYGSPGKGNVTEWPQVTPGNLTVMKIGLKSELAPAVSNPARFAALSQFAAEGGVLMLF